MTEEKPKLNFMSYIFMMYQSGLIALGKVENPITKKATVELEEARGVISILEIIEDKTKGNLVAEEEKTLKMVMDSLRFNYIEEANKKEKPSKDQSKEKNENGQDVH